MKQLCIIAKPICFKKNIHMEIAEIKAQLTLARVLQHYGLKPDNHLRLHYPFRDYSTPSLQVCKRR